MNRNLFVLSGVFCAVLFLCSCSADYSAEALAKARKFALEHTRTVPEIARNHIRYTPPQVQNKKIFGHQAMLPTDYAHLPPVAAKKANALKDFMEINFVWTFPGADYSIVVLGKGLRNFQHWEGVNVILKRVVPERTNYENARYQAVGYVVNNMLELARTEHNRVRFSEAEVYQTCFELDHFSVPFHPKGGPDAWKKYLAQLKQEKERFQYSLVWKGDDTDHLIVVSGWGMVKEYDPYQEKALASWSVVTGMVIPKAQFNKYVIRKVDTYSKKPVKITYQTKENSAAEQKKSSGKVPERSKK